jgi:hypothetical protein
MLYWPRLNSPEGIVAGIVFLVGYFIIWPRVWQRCLDAGLVGSGFSPISDYAKALVIGFLFGFALGVWIMSVGAIMHLSGLIEESSLFNVYSSVVGIGGIPGVAKGVYQKISMMNDS